MTAVRQRPPASLAASTKSNKSDVRTRHRRWRSVADAGDLPLTELVGLIAERRRILDQLLLNLRVLFEQGLLSQKKAFERERLDVVALERQRLVGRLEAFLN